MASPSIIPLFGLGVQQKSRPADAQRRVNLYYEVQQDPDRTRVVAYGTPGLDLFAELGTGPARGFYAPPTSQYAFSVRGDTFYQIDSAGALTSRGTIGTNSGAISMIDDGRYIALVDGLYGYYYDMNNPATPIAQIADPDFPNGAQTITWLGYFIAGLGGAFYISDPNTPVSWPGDSATAESSPDNLLLVLADHQDLTLFGGESIEFWTNTGNADFPFERIPGTTSEWGLAARNSVASFDDALMLLAKNRLGQIICARLQGYRVTRVSNHELEAKWAAFSTTTDAVAYSYMLDGHPMYVVSFPTGGETWMYDGSSNGWSQLQSWGLTRHRSALHAPFNGMNYVTDFENGNIYRLRADKYTDNGQPIRRVIVGRHVFEGYRRMSVDAFQLDIETGVGLATGQGSNPQAMLRISRDGARTWGPERWESFGEVGQYTKRCIWRRNGRARDFTFEIAITDPVKVAIIGAGIQPRIGKS